MAFDPVGGGKKIIGTKQSGVARLLKCPASATIDSLVKTLPALGATPKRIAALI
jgi:hypothetical protein